MSANDAETDHDHVGQIIAQWKTERPDLDASPVAIIGRLHRLSAVLYVELDKVYREYGVGDGEFDVLATLRRNGAPYSLTPSALSDGTMVTSGAITKRVDRLVAAGLVTREVSPNDARGRVITLSAKGFELIDKAIETHYANEARLIEPLSVDERRTLAGLLAKWGNALDV